MNVKSMKEAISELSADEKTALTAWLLQQDIEEWDKQIERDFSAGGAAMHLVQQAEADVRAGRVKAMDQFLSEAKGRRDGQNSSR